MLPTPKNYSVYPSVFPVGREVTLTVLAAEPCFIPEDGAAFVLTIRPIDCDENYYHPHCFVKKEVVAEGGALHLSYLFDAESEYLLFVERNGVRVASLSVYALDEDLYKLRPMKGDLHSHSFRSDGARDPAALAGHFREQGYDFFALTDHNRYYPGDEIDTVFKGVNTELLHIPGEEVHAPESTLHIVHVGGERSVAHRYIHEREAYEAEVLEYLAKVPSEIPEALRERYAKAMWAVDQIHEAGGLAILAHPFWRPLATGSINIPISLARLLLASGKFDAFEVLGCAGYAANQRQAALWHEMCCEGVRIPIVSSSDVHGIQGSPSFPFNYTLCFVRERSVSGVKDAIREGLSTAVFASGTETAPRYECLGSLRLVSYAQFLLRTYFHELARIAKGEGVLMRAYAMGEDCKRGIEEMARTARTYRARFFGDEKPPIPSKALCARAQEFRRVQRELGPITKGSQIDGVENRNL